MWITFVDGGSTSQSRDHAAETIVAWVGEPLWLVGLT
jgi:hypothetical protein